MTICVLVDFCCFDFLRLVQQVVLVGRGRLVGSWGWLAGWLIVLLDLRHLKATIDVNVNVNGNAHALNEPSAHGRDEHRSRLAGQTAKNTMAGVVMTLVLMTSCCLLATVCGAGVDDLPYRYAFPTDYTIKMMCNPCEFSDSSTCCDESYGAMECVRGCVRA